MRRRWHLRSQQVILEETAGLTNVVDWLGGSYAIETLTAEIERRVHAVLEEFVGLGGALACIEWVGSSRRSANPHTASSRR